MSAYDPITAYQRIGRDDALAGKPARPPHRSPSTESYWIGYRAGRATYLAQQKGAAKPPREAPAT